MKILMQSLIFSSVVHIIYIGGIVGYSRLLTRSYIPDSSRSYENVTYLQNEIVFGYAGRPIYIVFSIIISTLIGTVFIQLFREFSGKRRSR